MGATTMRTWTAALRRRARGAASGLALGCALLGTTGVASAEELGRLFFTPQQRQDLDRQRDTPVAPASASASVSSVENRVTVNGHVTRSSGKTTTWINGAPQYDTYRGTDRVAIQGSGAAGVKVGQTLDREQGKVQDPLLGGEIKVNRDRRP
jgi:hypothetical protein